MKIQFEGKLVRSTSANFHSMRLGEIGFTYEKRLKELAAFLKSRPDKIKITLEYETPIGSCLLCQGEEVELSPAASTYWHFRCTTCDTLVVLKATTREYAIEYFNQGEPR